VSTTAVTVVVVTPASSALKIMPPGLGGGACGCPAPVQPYLYGGSGWRVVPVGCRFRRAPFVNSDEAHAGERHRIRHTRDKETGCCDKAAVMYGAM